MGLFLVDREFADDGSIISFGPYRPWSWHKQCGGDGSNYPSYSGRILDLKDAKNQGIEFFREMLDPLISSGFCIASVPSHNPSKPFNGIRHLSAALCRQGKRMDATECLVRHTLIPKRTGGGGRNDEDVHLNSIAVHSTPLIVGRPVLLLDDVTTSGTSLRACRKLLMRAGAVAVQCAALGETTFA